MCVNIPSSKYFGSMWLQEQTYFMQQSLFACSYILTGMVLSSAYNYLGFDCVIKRGTVSTFITVNKECFLQQE